MKLGGATQRKRWRRSRPWPGAVRPAAVVLLALAVLGSASGARANVAARGRNPGITGGPAVLGPTPLVVEREDLSFSCDDGGRSPSCSFEASYFVHNPTRASQRVVAAFYGLRTRGAQVFIDGVRARYRLSPREEEALDAVAWPARRKRDGPVRRPRRNRRSRLQTRFGALSRTGLVLSVQPGQRRRVTVRGRVAAGRFSVGHYSFAPARVARHLALAPRAVSGLFHLDYLLAPIRSWGAVGPIRVVVRFPTRWKFTGSVQSVGSPRAAGRGVAKRWARHQEGDLTVARLLVRATDGDRLVLGFDVPRPAFQLGGPLVGFGAALGDGGGFRMRFGYEVGVRGWLLGSVNLDTDFRGHLVVAPVIEAVTPSFLLLPSVGLGVGLPVRVKPTAEVGVRFQLSVGLAALTFVASLDYYPSLPDAHPDRFRATLLGQISF